LVKVYKIEVGRPKIVAFELEEEEEGGNHL
jgi:hypothetical protein